MRKKLLTILTSILLVCVIAMCFVACSNNGGGNDNNTSDINADPQIVAVYNLYVANAQSKGETPLSYEEWLASIKGEKGDKGEDGETGATIEKVEYDEKGRLIITLTNGTVLEPVEVPKKHTYGTWNVYDWGDGTCEDMLFYSVCSTCNEIVWKHGAYADHDWDIETIESTCQTQGYDHKTCNLCEKEEKVNYQPVSDHKWQTEYTIDNSYHWIKCNDCTVIKDKEEHTPDNSGYCAVCDGAVGATEGVLYDLSIDQTYAEVVGYEGTAKRVIIAEEYLNKPVKSIYESAFKNSNIISVMIPDNVESIGSSAFSGCSSLTSVTIGNSVTSIGEDAFYGCSSALYTTENNLKYVKANGNPYCILIEATNKNLSTYMIHSTTKHIGYGVFCFCSILSSIEIPNSVTSIGFDAFSRCSSLTSVTIGNSVTSIGDGAFSWCSKLTSVVIGNNVTSIYDGAFSNCSSLTSIEIPNSVTSIGNYTFYGCSSLTSIKYRGTEEEWLAISKGDRWDTNTGSYTITYNYTAE